MTKRIFLIPLVLSVVLVFGSTGSVMAAGISSSDSAEGYETEADDVNGAEEPSEEIALFVESEFAPLKKVIVSQSEFTDIILPVSQVYIPLDELETNGGELVGDVVIFHADQEIIQQMEREREALVSVLEQYGVEVVMPRKLTEEERALATDPNGPTHGKGLTNFFVRDPFVVVGDHVIESGLSEEYRRYEALTAKDLFPESCSYVAMPVADITDAEDGPFLEGRDVIVYHDQVFVGNSGCGSNTAGIEWLRSYLEPYGYEVTEVRLQGNILHLDCAMSLVKEGLMIVCEESFADGIPEAFSEWDRITVPEEDAKELAVNGLSVNPEVYITDIAFQDTIGKGLEEQGIKVEYLDFSATRSENGSIHCSTQPILRVSESEEAGAFTYVHDPRENPEAMADIVENPDAVFGFSPDPESARLGAFAEYDWTDPEFASQAREERIAYHESMDSMTDILYQMREEGASIEEMARAVSEERNRLRLAAYEGDPEGLEAVKKSNLETYGHEDGPTPDELFEKYGSWTVVLQRAFSTNMGMDACCGLYDEYYWLYVELGYVE